MPSRGHRDLEEALAASSDVAFEHQPAGQDMLYSSGTTGRPKAIRTTLPDRQVTEPGDTMLAVFAPMYGFGPDTVYLSPAPLYHAAPLRFCGLITATGGTAVIMTRFDPEEALRLVEEHRVTHSQWVPTMFVRMLKLPAEVRERYASSTARGDPRGRPVPGRGQAPDDRVVGADPRTSTTPAPRPPA